MSQSNLSPMEPMLPRTVINEDADGTREMDLLALHMQRGRIFIEGEITDEMANRFAALMLRLADEGQDAHICINSPGGRLSAGMLMYDIIRSFPGTCTITCMGLAASMAAVLLAAGQKGRRYILPHAKVMIHEPLVASGFGGSASSIERTAQEILAVRDLANGIIAEGTGKTLAEINAVTAQDFFMDARQAVEFGICDEIRSMYDAA